MEREVKNLDDIDFPKVQVRVDEMWIFWIYPFKQDLTQDHTLKIVKFVL